MPRRGSSREKGMDIDCTKTNHNVGNYRPKNSIHSNGSSVLKTPSVSPARRQSPRLKAINAIYESENSSTPTQIKIETITIPDVPTINETLKDLRAKCKAKKRKSRKSVASSTLDLNHTLVKPKEEDSGLEEPLICLKLKLLNKYSKDRKRRKCTRLSVSPTPIKDIATDIKESVDENLEATLNKDPSAACRIQLVYNVKSEILETCETVNSTSVFINNCSVLSESHCSTQMRTKTLDDISQSVNKVIGEVTVIDHHESEGKVDVSASSDLNLIPILNDPSNSSSGLQEKTDKVESDDKDLTSFTTEVLNCSVNKVSNEFMEIDSCSLSENNEENFGENKMASLEMSCHNINCRVNEAFNAFMEIDSYSLLESNEENSGENKEMASSEMSCHNVSSFFSESKTPMLYSDSLLLVSATIDLSSDDVFIISMDGVIHGSIRNQINSLATTDNQRSICANISMESKTIKEFESRGDEMPECTHESNTTIDNILCNRDVHDLCHASGFSEEVGSLDSLVLSALSGTTRGRSNDDYNNSHIGKSFPVGTSDHCSACELPVVNECSPESEILDCSSIEQMLSVYKEKSVYSGEIDGKELMETVDCHFPQVSQPCLSATDDSLSKAAEICLSISEEKLNTIVDSPTCSSSEMSSLVELEGPDMENEIKQDLGLKVDHHPKKLLSNRKEFSPTSQEKLLLALNGNELDDTNKAADYGKAEAILIVERMTKKSKSSRNSSLQPLFKGILKSPDKSEKTTSCSKDSLIHVQAQKAVTFSQRQMQDIENIATKLLKELTYMKNIVVAGMSSEACPSFSSKFTPEETRIAVENASNLEATTKKWLSMMAKDCNRFCKIMKSTENKNASPLGVIKRQKKITFADEAGGSLCHVKVFEQLPASFIVPRTNE